MTALGLLPRRLRSPRACSRRAGSMFQERGSLSTNTGVAADLLLEGVEVGAGGGDAGIGGGSDRVAGVGAGAHGAELDAAERAAVAPHARLHKKAGPGSSRSHGVQRAGRGRLAWH